MKIDTGLKAELVELLCSAPCESEFEGQPGSCPDRRHGLCREVGRLHYCAVRNLADHLIANGVTVQRWIPVEEQLPELIPCGAGTAYSEAVNILTTGRKVLTAIWDGTEFVADAEFWEAEGEKITHWTPVLLPLPEHTGRKLANNAEKTGEIEAQLDKREQ